RDRTAAAEQRARSGHVGGRRRPHDGGDGGVAREVAPRRGQDRGAPQAQELLGRAPPDARAYAAGRGPDRHSAAPGFHAPPCSPQLDRSFSHGAKKTRELTAFDQQKRKAQRVTTLPQDGGKSDFDIPSCARDALAFVYFARREMGQGRVAPEQTVFFGAGYSV